MEPIFVMQFVCCGASSVILHLEMYLKKFMHAFHEEQQG